MQNYPNDSSLLGHLQKQLTKNSLSINRPEKVGNGLPFPTFLDTKSSKTVTAKPAKQQLRRGTVGILSAKCASPILRKVTKRVPWVPAGRTEPGFGRLHPLETDTICDAIPQKHLDNTEN